MNEIDHLGASLLAEIAEAQDEAALEQVRIGALGKAGSISALLKTLGAMTPDERKEKGPLINGLRDQVQTALSARKEALAEAALEARLSAETIDVSLPVREGPEARGRIHPISQVIDEITAIFGDMGFSIAEGPDVETDDLNFTRLNFPVGHPA
ncbi:MAG: phenylalanine--tRNA ligase subunit alpha, partial [Bosea sp. 32-68-6]